MKIPLKSIEIPKKWNIYKNDFSDIEPDNTLAIDDVFYYFTEDIFQATYNEYCIDLGFYGNYSEDRSGNFRIIVLHGDFAEGKVLEDFISRDTDEIKIQLEFYLKKYSL